MASVTIEVTWHVEMPATAPEHLPDGLPITRQVPAATW
ncbi:hypothetical protein Hsw_4082 [Hymenobacter swuensis DY53]|uniref:Uncharacterized protein n=1 Tax=Hymenobacter swuensis DY53 TaxID=1227739 RepID=W8F6M4_9BACT|nr:hypothetical protein Hsw_4082 [Hymenobacter swuensis DY53]